jgi:hypothetical protein
MRFNKKTFLIEGKDKILVLLNCYRNQPLKYFLITSIVLLTVIKLSLIGTGFLAFPDEFRYAFSRQALRDLSELKIRPAINDIFSTQARPADVILKTIPNAIQFVTAKIFKLNYYESNNSYPLFIFNFFIYCFILIVHFKFSKLVLKDSFLALISVVLFSSLTNSYLYLRHALAFDTSLLIFYLIIYRTVKYTEEDGLSFRKCFLLGFFSFFGYLVYPGYFPLFIVGLFLIFFNNLTKKDFIKKIYYSGYYFFGGIFCLIIFEIMSRLGGRSYILDALIASRVVTQGSSEESFTFIIKYLFAVEGLTGIILIISLTLFCFIILNQIISKTFRQHSLIMLLGIVIIGLFLAYAGVGYFLSNLILMGRSLHQYFPFICIFSLFSINKILIKITSKNELILFIISIVFMINFGVNFIHYNSFSYPRDIAWKLSKTINLEDIENVCEYDDSWSVMPSKNEYTNSDIHTIINSQFHNILVTNCCYIYPVNDLTKYHLFYPKDNYTLMESKPHFINFKPYQYEGYSIVERHNIDKINLQIKLFSKK